MQKGFLLDSGITKSGGLLHCDISQLYIVTVPKPVRQGVLGKSKFIIAIMKF